MGKFSIFKVMYKMKNIIYFIIPLYVCNFLITLTVKKQNKNTHMKFKNIIIIIPLTLSI